MSVMIYSQQFGFRTLEKIPNYAVPGTLLREEYGLLDTGGVATKWFIMRSYKSHTTHKSYMTWVLLDKEQIPVKVKMEALLLGIVL